MTRQNTTTLEDYQVLAIFSEHYNKRLVHWDQDRVVYHEGSKIFKTLSRMVVKDGIRWIVFSIKSMSEVVSVDGEFNAGF